MTSTGVVVMAYGTPASRDEIETYYTDIRRGRPPTAEQLADLVRRYDAIGGTSPLAARTRAQAAALQTALDARAPGTFGVGLGLKHAAPTIEDGVASLVADGASRVVGLVLAPHYSALSIGEYLGRAGAAAADAGASFTGIESWATEPAYVRFLARAVAVRLASMPTGTRVLFTAHSLPERIVAAGDPYPDELAATAAAVAAAAELPPGSWGVAWQSAGRTPEPWLGPDVLTVIDDLASDGEPGAPGVLVCPCGFVSDHLEVLYDLDIEARARAAEVGLAFERTAVANDDQRVIDALAERVLAA